MSRSRFLTELARAVSWHRRKLAVVAAVAAVVTTVNAATPPDPPSASVLMSTRALAAGTRLTGADLALRTVPRSLLPDRSLSGTDDLVGRTLVAAVPAGAMLTELSVLSARTVQTPGQVIAPVEIGDAAVVALLRPGDLIDLVATDSRLGRSSIAVRSARVITVPQPPADASITAPASAEGSGQLVLVEVSESEATTLAQAGSAGQLGVILH